MAKKHNLLTSYSQFSQSPEPGTPTVQPENESQPNIWKDTLGVIEFFGELRTPPKNPIKPKSSSHRHQ